MTNEVAGDGNLERNAPHQPGTDGEPGLRVIGYGLLAIAIASALVCGVTFAMWASDDSGKFTAKLAASIATGAAAVLLGVVCGYVFAMAARSERRAVGVEEPRNLTLREGMRQQWPYAKSAKDAEEP